MRSFAPRLVEQLGAERMRPRNITVRACRQRQESTVAERILWAEFRNHRLNGWSFRRQADVAGFIADFVCHDPKLVVEIDGPVHDRNEQAVFDKQRDAKMEAVGFAVLRVDERQAREATAQVLSFVGRRVEEGLSPFPEISE